METRVVVMLVMLGLAAGIPAAQYLLIKIMEWSGRKAGVLEEDVDEINTNQ